MIGNRILFFELQNRNRNYPDDHLTLKYERIGADKIALTGLNQNLDSIHVVLKKVPKIYILNESYQLPKKQKRF